ncbi:hypothetical protein DV735_g817, partial [Chaetothyriales sp. CBS 134920]
MVLTRLEKRLQEVLSHRQQNSKLRSLKSSPAHSVDFSSNDFLSLSSNAELREDYLRALNGRDFPLGSTGSRLLDGNSSFAESLERDIAAFHGAEAGLLINSGFDANVSIFTYLPQPGDIVIFDELIHASVHDGMRQSRARESLAFRHNDIQDLRKRLIRCSNKSIASNIFVAVESVYSMDGDLAPLKEIAELIEELFPAGNAHMIVDEAHATGIYGPLGAGRVSELGLEKRVSVRLHTFGKALASNGEEQIDRFVATASEWLMKQKGVRMKMTVKRLRDLADAPPKSTEKSPSTLAKLASAALRPRAMVYELHIWGPAFGLPSIDAQCLATVAYLSHCLSRREGWVLIPTSDPALNPLGQLPALKHGAIWIGGYRDIVTYLRTSSSGEYDLCKGLTSTQQADCAAYSSFIESRAQPILDLSLYVSSENYSECTKPALASVLTWPNSWFMPHKLRERAKKRSDHLGLSGLDLDTGEDEQGYKGLAAQIPKSLQKPRQTLSSVLGQEKKRSKFRLNAVTSDFLEPLEEMLGGQKWLVADSVTGADCLALAYLSLLRGPASLPQPWVWDTVKRKHPELHGWVLENDLEFFGPPVSVKSITESTQRRAELPWQAPSPRKWHDVLNSTVLNVASTTTGLSSVLDKGVLKLPKRVESTPLNKQEEKQKAVVQLQAQRLFYSQLFGSSLCTAIVTGLLLWNGVLSLPRRTNALPRVRHFGEAGAFLGLQ